MAMRCGTFHLRRLHSITAPKAERSDTQMAASTSGHSSTSRTTASPPCFIEMGGVPKEMTRESGSPSSAIAAS